jgi:hypothetical protein
MPADVPKDAVATLEAALNRVVHEEFLRAIGVVK